MKLLPKKKVEDALDHLKQSTEVYAPILRGPNTGFFKWGADPDFDDLVLDDLNTYLSPKQALLPQTQSMYRFKTEGKDASITAVADDFKESVVFGVRPCDLKAVEALDQVFLTKGFVDEFYQKKRDKTTIVANACYKGGPKCFCESMGVDRLNPSSADVLIHEIEDRGWAWEPKTEKGQKLTEQLASFLEEAGEVKMPHFFEQKKKVNIEGLPDLMRANFESKLWEDLAERCLTCGVCTNVCPSCYCFDVQVTNWGNEGYRFRCWDSCMYREYSNMAGGHNPRDQKKERFRNRFLHKLEFFNERYGTPLCTGCGRCIVMCPVQVNILEVIDKVREAGANG
ncbi:MAG: 4Fe-4S dicluster domain-containing protein [Solirubrobacterales bacterium]